MFSYQINKNIKLKILEEREAEQLFKLVDSNRDYLAEFLPFVEHTKKVEDSKHFIHSALQQFIDGNGFHCGIWSNKELIGVIGLHYLDLVNKTTSIGYYLAEDFQKKGIMTKCT
ncbi:GNAT family N-acetyltransferase, partial [Staphylococcus epidermidis]|nr:GNAT family N-acetyltransferase [Staphylococcus epidermidis]